MLRSMKRYEGARGKKNVSAIEKAIERSGGVIVNAANPSIAPFELTVQLPSRAHMELVCYAFTANQYKQKGRPKDEHRFQVKYGSDFKRPHEIYIDESRRRITLFFGYHEELDLFIAVDPAMHNPTWFSSSIEFKEEDLQATRRKGWHGWERERVAEGRRQVHPQANLCTEVVLAFTPEHFLTYVQFEAESTGLDPGERLLFIDKISDALRNGVDPYARLAQVEDVELLARIQHPLLRQFQLSVHDVLDILSSNFRLLAAVRGAVAEHHLHRLLQATEGISEIEKLDLDGQPDFKVVFRGEAIRIECKNVLRKQVGDWPRVDFQKTRASKGNPCSRYYSASQFELLAACVHPVTERWDFRFQLTSRLSPHKRCPSCLSDRVVVDEFWTSYIREALNEVAAIRPFCSQSYG